MAWSVGFLLSVGAGAQQGKGAFDTPEAYDALMERQGTACLRGADDGTYAWGESYVMTSFVVMYRNTGDRKYLDRLIEHADGVLANRDRVLGRKDYLGRSLPAWSAGGHYSIGEIRLKDASGTPTLYLRSSLTGSNDRTEVTVSAEKREGTFDLHIVNDTYNREERFVGLTMNPASPAYAVPRIMASKLAAPFSHMRLFAEDLGSRAPPSKRNPVPVTTRLQPSNFVWPVHQGMILEALTDFARVVMERPELRREPHYAAKAREYIAAAEATFAALEEQWRENDAGEGWYAVPKGAPIWMDGCDEPHNHYLAVGSAMLNLTPATGDAKWAERVAKMATTIKNDLELNAETNGYVWTYWWTKGHVYKGWSPRDGVSRNTPGKYPTRSAEDFSHASVDVNFMYRCARDGIVFTREDLIRLANTFLKHIVRRGEDGVLTFADRVDGKGKAGTYDRLGPSWVRLAEVAPSILDLFREIRRDSPWNGYALWMLQSANMNAARLALEPAAAGGRRE